MTQIGNARDTRATIASRRVVRVILAPGAWAALCCFMVFMEMGGCQMPSADTNSSSDFSTARARLLAELRAEGITNARVLHALEQVPRHEFVRPVDHARAYDNRALPIGGGQTISQPYIVAVMSQLAELHDSDRVLEIGTGSGYQAAVLALLSTAVYSIEIDPVLADTARQRLVRLGYHNVTVRAGDGFYGWEEEAPFDAILVTAAAPRIPERLVAQLTVGGRLVMPLGDGSYQTLIRGRKTESGLAVERFDDVLFVPMTGAIRSPTP